MNVVFLPEVVDYLDDLTYNLYLKGYFGFYETAKKYTDGLIDDVHRNIARRVKYKSPPRFKRYGTHYITYKPNRRTTWYIFFSFKDDRYLVRYITNNHKSAQHIRGLK